MLALELIGWIAGPTRAIEVTWTGSVDSNWSNGGNWNIGKPLTGDSVVFANTAQTNVRADFSSYPETDPRAFDQPALHLESVTFAPAAPAYAVELYVATDSSFYQANVTYDGAGVINSSSVMQHFVIDSGSLHAKANGEFSGVDGSRLTFNNSTSAGSNVTYHALGGVTTAVSGPTGPLFLRPSGASILFNNNASAGSATLIADGGTGNGGLPAFVEFHNNSTAASGNFISNGGALGVNLPGQSPDSVCGFGGETIFFDSASAGTAHFTVNGTPGAGGSGGLTKFTQNSTAANAVFVTNPAAESHVGPGIVQFFDSATAANGNFTNTSGPLSTSNGFTQFWDNTTAANARIDNLSGPSTYGGTTSFHDHATAATAVINNRGLSGGGNGGLSGDTGFYDDSTASSAIIHNWTGPDAGGITEFHGNSTAANSHIILEPGNNGGSILFHDNATAGSAHLDAGADGATGTIDFREQSTAANSLIDLDDNAGFNLHLRFFDSASAGNATINGGSYSNVQFFNNSTAGNANITVRASCSLVFAGSFAGPPTTTAGNATIHVLGGNSIAPNGMATFGNYSAAADANIVIEGAAFADAGAATLAFASGSDAGNATILLKSSPISGDHGGALTFNGGSAPNARITTEAGSLIVLVGNPVYGDPSLGSVEGAGAMIFNGAPVTIGHLGMTTTFSGPISGFGGSLIKAGAGTFTLTGADTYTGNTTVSAGTLVVGSSLTKTSSVSIAAGATLFLNGGTVAASALANAGTLQITNGPVTINGDATNAHSASILLHNGTFDVAGMFTNHGILSSDPSTLEFGNLDNEPDGTIIASPGDSYIIHGKFTNNGGTISIPAGASFTTTGPLMLSGGTIGGDGVTTAAGGLAVSNSVLKTGIGPLVVIGNMTLAEGAKLDLNQSDLILDYSEASPASTVRGLLASGFNAGSWDGAGIPSQTAHDDASFRTALGYAENRDIGYLTFDGQSLDATTILLKYTYYGDSNLDAVVNAADFTRFLDGLATGGTTWSEGDYTYDGKVDLGNDFNLFLAGYIAQGGVLGDLSGVIENNAEISVGQKAQLLSAVPEPSPALSITLTCCSIALAQRRRCSVTEIQQKRR